MNIIVIFRSAIIGNIYLLLSYGVMREEDLSSQLSAFRIYFHDIDSDNIQMKLDLNPFRCIVDELYYVIREDLFDFIKDAAIYEFQD